MERKELVQRKYAVYGVGMMSDEPTDRVHLDSRQLRVLAHPLRVRLLAALRADGASTATALAARLGTNSGQTSYHLRQLADVGLVEDDPGRGTGRDRYWRAAHQMTHWEEPDADAPPEDRAASDWLVGRQASLVQRWMQTWIGGRADVDPAWRAVAGISDYAFHLTPDQLGSLTAELTEVLERYRTEVSDPSAEGASRVIGVVAAFPQDRVEV